MFLESIKYAEYERTRREWKLEEFALDNINLIVGKNATGKTRILNIIGALANLLCGYIKMQFASGNYEVTFDNNGNKIEYVLKYERSKILREKLTINSKTRLNRTAKSTGTIYYEKEGKDLEFQIPVNELAVFARRDSIQHPFLDDLYSWGKSVTHYRFGTTLGQDRLAVFAKAGDRQEEQAVDLKDTHGAVVIFRKGLAELKERFSNSIIKDMETIRYDLQHISLAKPYGLVVHGPPMGRPIGLQVQESDLRAGTDQVSMSQGMFRTLSLIIQTTYSQLTSTPSCILVDDIGEGLDYERSSALLKLLVEKVRGTSIQLIMATNDRFVMNSVPLEYWAVIDRTGGKCKIYNYRNSPKLFDDFALTGLNNFDFFSSNYYLKDISEN